MGAKTALLAFSDGDLRPALISEIPSLQTEAERLVHAVHPGREVTPTEDEFLTRLSYPPADRTYARVLAGAEILCDRRLVLDRPSELPEHLLKLGEGRRILMHGMHSVNDLLCFAVWENGTLIRSLSLSPDGGITENIGEPLVFEHPFWAGEHPVEADPDWEDEEPYPLSFHPLEMGEEALRALYGFVREGYPQPDDINADAVRLHGFIVR
ncbi:DUF6928 family protein [Actinoplanes xinjiangensis]|uniref:Uncharacterized protein n=1 Tax=Actinoplanes xinjiangensis TaxID=512350 RepID=A0A316F762_9ACTN|nr:hypothetical protein [Actinoplanes xinjiangensis]PWK40085.1 hypothetical protein BC793_12024 [Actinoplanes xinjiangensis]GIF42399.1 hypothetical protein Axi01nite_67100 [Actinoplanes xinjiangensis]